MALRILFPINNFNLATGGDGVDESDGVTVTGGLSGNPPLVATHFTRIGNKLIFEGEDPSGATRQLWFDSGPGPNLSVRTINPSGDAFPPTDVNFLSAQFAALFQPVLFNGFVYLAANDGVHGFELWRTDGTSAGTNLFVDINKQSAFVGTTENSNPQTLTVSGNFLYFTADDGIHGQELWKTDGTSTQLVADLSPGSNPTSVFQMTDSGGTLFFVAQTKTSSTLDPTALFVTDGTTVTRLTEVDGTAPVVAFNGKIYFRGGASDVFHGLELWVSDGTVAGTHIAADINTQPGFPGTNLGSSPNDLTVFNGALYFAADDGIHGDELWKFDGAAATLVKDVNPFGSDASNPLNLTVVGNHLFFTADDGLHGVELWVTDGTSAGTHLVQDINTKLLGTGSSNPTDLQNVDGTLYFAASDGTSTNFSTLYKTDGTTVSVVASNYVTNTIYDPFGFINFPAANDVNDDGISDVLWRHTGGEVDSWAMEGGRMGGGTAVSSLSSAWQFAGAGYFPTFGNATLADLFWRNTATGEVDTWDIANGRLIDGSPIGMVSSAWQPLGAGDFNNDGTSDVLWRNTSGEVDTWLMGGGQIIGGTGIGFVSSAWQFAGMGDFNGDQTTDLLWHNTATGEVDTWLMGAGQMIGGRALGAASSAWQALGAGRFSGNASSDILWRNPTTGEVDIWFVNNDQMTGGTVVGSVSSAWQFAGIGDVTGSGESDIIWRNTVTGEVDTWLIDNGRISGGTAIGNVSSAWTPLVIPTA